MMHYRVSGRGGSRARPSGAILMGEVPHGNQKGPGCFSLARRARLPLFLEWGGRLVGSLLFFQRNPQARRRRWLRFGSQRHPLEEHG
jgi:hypothetical protein